MGAFIIIDKTDSQTFSFSDKNKAEKKYNQIRKQGHQKEAYVECDGERMTMWENTWSEK